ncbi:hypothetical protein [Paraburkholderia sp. MM6662-R1]|uniref:hypothetical protein n=1 Tax=Paraburkholderia sp. MM6662-R1 TaxID=2991066 RepID=UPI003D249E42
MTISSGTTRKIPSMTCSFTIASVCRRFVFIVEHRLYPHTGSTKIHLDSGRTRRVHRTAIAPSSPVHAALRRAAFFHAFSAMARCKRFIKALRDGWHCLFSALASLLRIAAFACGMTLCAMHKPID